MIYTDDLDGILFKLFYFHSYLTFKNKLDSENMQKIADYLRVRTEVAGNCVKNKKTTFVQHTETECHDMTILLLIQELPASNLCRVLTILLTFPSVHPSKCPCVRFEVSTAGWLDRLGLLMP